MSLILVRETGDTFQDTPEGFAAARVRAREAAEEVGQAVTLVRGYEKGDKMPMAEEARQPARRRKRRHRARQMPQRKAPVGRAQVVIDASNSPEFPWYLRWSTAQGAEYFEDRATAVNAARALAADLAERGYFVELFIGSGPDRGASHTTLEPWVKHRVADKMKPMSAVTTKPKPMTAKDFVLPQGGYPVGTRYYATMSMEHVRRAASEGRFPQLATEVLAAVRRRWPDVYRQNGRLAKRIKRLHGLEAAKTGKPKAKE